VTVYRGVQRFAPRLADAARPCRHAVGDRWEVDETSLKVVGRWRYVYRAVDQAGQVIDGLRHAGAAGPKSPCIVYSCSAEAAGKLPVECLEARLE